MKNYLLIIFLLIGIHLTAQVKISEMPTLSGNPTGSYVPAIRNGINYKISSDNLGWNKVDTLYERNDSLFGKKHSEEFFITTATGSGGGSGNGDTIYISVKPFGATGDGVTDDGPAIQNTNDFVASIGGGVVWFPAGTYKVTQPVYRASGVNWFGVKDQSIIRNTESLTTFNSQGVMFMGNYSPSDYDTTVAKFYRGHMGTRTNKMAIVDSISRFAPGDLVVIESMTGWTSNDGHYKPYVTRFNEIDSVDEANDSVTFKYQVDTLLADARIQLTGHFISNDDDANNHLKYMVKDCETKNLVFESNGHWILGMTSLNCKWENIRIKASELFTGNGMAFCTANNIYGQWWKQVSEFAIGCHNTTITGINAHYINGPDDGERKPYIKFGEESWDITMKDVFINAGNFQGTGVWFGAASNSTIDGIHVEGNEVEKTHIEFSDNSLDDPPGSHVNNNIVRNGYFKNASNLQSYVLMERSTTADGQLRNNKVSNVTFVGPVSDATAFVLDGYRPELKDIYASEGEITGGDSLYKGIISGGSLANIYDLHGNTENIFFRSVFDSSGRNRSHFSDIILKDIPDNVTVDGQLYYDQPGDHLNFRHNGTTTDLLAAAGGSSSVTIDSAVVDFDGLSSAATIPLTGTFKNVEIQAESGDASGFIQSFNSSEAILQWQAAIKGSYKFYIIYTNSFGFIFILMIAPMMIFRKNRNRFLIQIGVK